jgi:hypothetical protein
MQEAGYPADNNRVPELNYEISGIGIALANELERSDG